MPSRRRRPDELPDHRVAEAVRGLRHCHDGLVKITMVINPYSETARIVRAAMRAIEELADKLTGRPAYLAAGTSSATQGQLAEAAQWAAWEAGKTIDKPGRP